jgi:excisionase family DNA binding protein
LDELLSVKQVADRLQAHIMTIYKLVRVGTLKATRVPGVGLRIEAKELEKLLGQNTRRSRTKRRRENSARPGK